MEALGKDPADHPALNVPQCFLVLSSRMPNAGSQGSPSEHHPPVSSPGMREVLKSLSHWAEQSGIVDPRRRICNKSVF